ncbi:hypothetical protein ES319_A12G047100v1, partial [Gossypium barbadense]
LKKPPIRKKAINVKEQSPTSAKPKTKIPAETSSRFLVKDKHSNERTKKSKALSPTMEIQKNFLQNQSKIQQILGPFKLIRLIFFHYQRNRARNPINPGTRKLSSPSFHRQSVGRSIYPARNKQLKALSTGAILI